MILNEEQGNLFSLDRRKYIFAHCISLDCEMGKGIAKRFVSEFKGLKTFCKCEIEKQNLTTPSVVLYYNNNLDMVFNLITKDKYWDKPTYESITKCIEELAYLCKECEAKHLAIPRIGCGLDRLEWSKVKEIIIDKFKDIDITIEVRYL